jgi:hypothetical protein
MSMEYESQIKEIKLDQQYLRGKTT